MHITGVLQLVNNQYLVKKLRMDEFNQSSDEDLASMSAPEMSMPRMARFWLLLAFELPGLICTLFLLFHLLMDRALRSALHNHVVVLLLFAALITQLIDIPAYLVFIIHGRVWPPHPLFCQLWWFVNVGIFLMTSILMAYASIERHILVFHDRLVSTQKRRLIFHYLPLITILLYGFIYYIVIIFFPSCEQIYDYSQAWCSYPCYFDEKILSIYDAVVNSILSIILTSLFSITLLVRVIYQKTRLHQPVRWHKHRKMTIQLLSIVSLYLVINLPVPVLISAHLLGLPPDVGVQAQLYSYFLCYFIPLLLPYVTLGSSSEMRKKATTIFVRLGVRRQQLTTTVAPTMNMPIVTITQPQL